jgi:hypothetical protein
MAQSYTEQVVSELKDQTQEGRGILQDIVKSHAFIYPLHASTLLPQIRVLMH